METKMDVLEKPVVKPVRQEKQPVDILNDKESKVVMHLALPIFFGMMFQLLYNITDTLWVSRIDLKDPSYVGGVGIVFPVFFLAVAIANGLTTGISSFAARAIGAKEPWKIGTVSNSMTLIVVLLAVAFVVPGYYFGEDILTFFGATDDYLVHSMEYFYYILPAIALLFIGSIYVGILQGKGNMGMVMMAMFVATLVNIILDPILIFVFDLKIKGAALATLISQALAFTYIVINFYRTKDRKPADFSIFKINWDVVKEITSVGGSQSLHQVLIAISYILFNYFIIRIDENALSAFAICGRVDQVVIIPIMAVSIALVTAIGQNYGEGKYDRVKVFWRIGNTIALVTVAILVLLLVILAPVLFRQFSEIEKVVSYAVLQVRTIEFGFLFVVIHTLACSYFQAINRPFPAVTLVVLRSLVLPVFAVAVLLFFHQLTIMGLWISILIVNGLTAVISWAWVYYSNKALPKN